MRHVVVSLLAIGSLVLAGCGDSGKEKDSPPAASAAPTPPKGSSMPMPNPTAGTKPAEPAIAMPAHVGVLEKQGPSITMEGTHKLVDGGKTVVLLEAKDKKIDLAAHEGKKVKVTGPSRQTVEGNQTIVEVQTIEDLP